MLKTIRNHHNVKSYFKEFSEISELVYFGAIGKDDDAHVYKGVTFHPKSIDTNYCHGTINGYDLTAFTRESRHTNHSGGGVTTKWTVIAMHLKMGGMPHLIFDSRKHDKTFYASVYTRFPRLRRAGSLLAQMNASASHYFDLYMKPESNGFATHIIDDHVLQRMISSFTRYNVEIDNDMLYVFAPGEPNSVLDLKQMLAETLWLAETIENRAHYTSSVFAVQ
jgi:hypothetical protein